jgi:methanogenic corrinoid protein MtbC1
MKISEIMNLPPDLMRERVMQLAIQSDGIESHLENLVIAMIELNEDLFDKTFNTSMIKLGFEKTIIQLIYPFFEKIGLLWQTGSIIPTQEHFISNLIRQKLIVAIDSITAPRSATAKSFLLYLPENEWHELGLLFKHYLIKKRGHRVIYLGPNVPFGNLKTVIQSVKPCCIVGQYITSRSFEESKTDLQNLAEYASSIQIFISGNFLQKNPDLLPKGLLAYKNIYEFLEQTE